jgi:hypothetical protein
MFSDLSLAADMGTSSQNNVLASQAYQLGDPKASLHSKQQQARSVQRSGISGPP